MQHLQFCCGVYWICSTPLFLQRPQLLAVRSLPLSSVTEIDFSLTSSFRFILPLLPSMKQTFPAPTPLTTCLLACLSSCPACPSCALNQPVSSRCLRCQRLSAPFPNKTRYHNLPARSDSHKSNVEVPLIENWRKHGSQSR